MSTKATKASRTVAKVLAGSNRAAEEARQASDATRLARDATNAAIAAACAAKRAGLTEGGRTGGDTGMRKVAKGVRAAAEEAVKHAKDAMRAEDAGDVVSATWSANLSLQAARRAGSLAAAASVISGTAREMASDREASEPSITVSERHAEPSRGRQGDALSSAVERAARYLVTYDGAIIAAFAREEDAFLLEGELADLDRAHGTASGKCEVLERRTGHRLGGYLLAGGKMLVFLHDDRDEKRYGRMRRS